MATFHITMLITSPQFRVGRERMGSLQWKHSRSILWRVQIYMDSHCYRIFRNLDWWEVCKNKAFFLPSGMAMLLHGYFTYILGFSTEILKKTNLMLILFLQLQNILGSISSFELLISGQKGMPIWQSWKIKINVKKFFSSNSHN